VCRLSFSCISSSNSRLASHFFTCIFTSSFSDLNLMTLIKINVWQVWTDNRNTLGYILNLAIAIAKSLLKKSHYWEANCAIINLPKRFSLRKKHVKIIQMKCEQLRATYVSFVYQLDSLRLTQTPFLKRHSLWYNIRWEIWMKIQGFSEQQTILRRYPGNKFQ